MNKIETYRQILSELDEWPPFLRQESRLPGPRGNLELAQAVADLGDRELFIDLLQYDPIRAPVNSPDEFLAFCGILGLGKLVAQGQLEHLNQLRLFSADPRWRIREAVAMALQRVGDADMGFLLTEMGRWSTGNFYEQRAVAAALAEPKLLENRQQVSAVLDLLDACTRSIEAGFLRRKEESFLALRKCLGYAWSVVLVASPHEGMKRLEQWLNNSNPDIRWIVKENLKKNRMGVINPAWLAWCREKLEDDPHVS